MKKIRILVVVNRLNHGGVESLLNVTQKYIDKNRFEMFYLCMQRNADRSDTYVETIEQNGGKVIFFPCSSASLRSYMPSTIRNIKKIIIDNKIDHHHHHLNGSFLVALVGRLLGRPIIVHSHSTKFYWPEKWLKKIVYIPVNITNLIVARCLASYRIAVGEKAGRFLFGRKQFQRLENGIDIDQFQFSEKTRDTLRGELGVAQGSTVIMHVGRMTHPKNQSFIVEIFSRYLRIRPNSKLILVGDGPDFNAVKRLVERLGLSRNVLLLGSRDDVDALYSVADVLLLPSFFEGVPVTLIEAQVNGLHCLVSDVIDREVKLTEGIEFFPLQESAESWADKINVMNNTRLDTRYIFENSTYNVRNTVKVLENIYEDVARGR